MTISAFPSHGEFNGPSHREFPWVSPTPRRWNLASSARWRNSAARTIMGRMNSLPNIAFFRQLPSLAASIVLLAAGTLFPVFATGCAGTATEKSTGEHIDDGVITTRVKTALLRDDVTPGTDIKVETYRGVVQLSGFVNTLAQKNRADELARTVPGVQQVVNNIVVK
jgi:hyperosmotically inducible protein